MGNKRIRWFSSFLCMVMLCLTGCWDRVEIEERGFVLAVAIDVLDDGEKLSVVQQFALPSGMQGSTSGGGSSSSQQKAYLNIAQEGVSVAEILSETSNKLSRIPYYQHNRIILISQEISQTPSLLRDVLDPFLRDEEMRRGVKVLISEGPAKFILDMKAPIESGPAKFIDLQADDLSKNLKMAQPVHIGNIQHYMLRKQSFALQLIVGEEEEIKIEGLAVIRGEDATLAGILSYDETVGVNFLTGGVDEGILRINQGQDIVAIEFLDVKHKVKVDATDKERIKFQIQIDAEAQGAQLVEKIHTQDASAIAKLEDEFGREIERITLEVVEKLQQEYMADVLGFGEQLRMNEYRLWEQIKDDWDRGRNYFAKCEVQVEAKINIRHFQNIQHSYKE